MTTLPGTSEATLRKLLLLTAAACVIAGPAFAAQRATENRGAYDPATDTTWVSSKAGTSIAVTQAAGAATTAKAEDSASADGDVGVPALCVRKATAANTSGTDGDYEIVQCSAGRLWVSSLIDTALPAGTNLIGKFGIDQTTPGTTNAVTTLGQYAASYMASTQVSLAASATDAYTFTGSASKTIYITKLTLYCTQTTSGFVAVFLAKHSAVDTGGTSSGMVNIPLNSTNAAATMTGVKYTANPTVGTSLGSISGRPIACNATTATVVDPTVFDFGARGQPVVLNGTSEQLAVNLNGVTVTGGVLYATVEWFER